MLLHAGRLHPAGRLLAPSPRSAFALRLLRLLLGFPGFRLGFRLRLDFNLTLALIVDLDFGSILAGFLLDFDFGLISASGFHLL